ncbi:MAG TPA: zinc-dependent metalloprotease family protein [Luteibacter sp.]|jgi:hypothetical protein|uniref:reprolysin-like metallopeptidase n=1 Tax=Luteibacter sp. TaxID=1886636 RepID=UPI002F40F394
MAGPASSPLADARAPLFAVASDGRAAAVVELPLADGTPSAFRMVDSRTLPPGLMRRFPAMRSFRGEDGAGRVARLDYAADVARLSIRDGARWSHLAVPLTTQPLVAPGPVGARSVASPRALIATEEKPWAPWAQVTVSAPVRYEFRLALAAGSRFTATHGGTRDAALGTLAHMANRANEVFENDLGVHFTLAANNERLVITDPEGDPMQHGEPRTAAVELIDRRLGASAYDLGHALLGPDLLGGESATGTSCSDARDADLFATHKAAAWSGAADPETAFAGMLFTLANQLGAPFRPNACWHCLSFDGASIGRVRSWLGSRGGRCAKKVLVDAAAPWIDPQSWEEPPMIPARTPFWLDASVEASMPDRHLTYTWDQIDEAPLRTAAPPTARTRREFTTALPAAARWMDYRLTVRDNGGATATRASMDLRVQVIDTGRPFAVLPTADTATASPLVVRWDPAGTTSPPLSCHFVDIALSRDNGATWQPLATGERNDGEASLPVPEGASAERARLRIACDWRPFFAESAEPFRIG